jgi:hypothetical protein
LFLQSGVENRFGAADSRAADLPFDEGITLAAIPDVFTATAIGDLQAILTRLDTHGGHGLAAIHIQWAIELLGGKSIERLEDDDDLSEA